MLYIVQFWREALIISLLLITYLLYNALSYSKLETAQFRDGLDYQNASLLAQKQSYDKKLAELPKEITKIKTKYEVIYRNIKTWKGDTNASDCNNTDTFLRSVQY